MKKRILYGTIVVLCFLSFGSFASATSLLLSEGTGYYAHYGDSSWGNMSATLDSATGGNVSVVSNFEDYSLMLSYDALWLDQRYNGSLSGGEVSNIISYLSTGRRVVMIGENDNWNSWNRQLVESIAGGAYGGGYSSGYYNASYAHELTDGVSSVYLPSGAYVASGGISLFNYGFATLWGNNLLTVLDSNIFTDSYWSYGNNAIFASNIGDWVADSNADIPEPATMLLLGSGLLGLGAMKRFKTQ